MLNMSMSFVTFHFPLKCLACIFNNIENTNLLEPPPLPLKNRLLFTLNIPPLQTLKYLSDKTNFPSLIYSFLQV